MSRNSRFYLKRLISDDLARALNEVGQHLDPTSESFNELVNLQGNFNEIQQAIRSGVISEEQKNLQLNRVRKTLLELIDTIPDKSFEKKKVFIHFHEVDRNIILSIINRLQDKSNIELNLDQSGLNENEEFTQEKEEALNRCNVLLVFGGASKIGSWLNEDLIISVEERQQDRNRALKVLPVLLPGAKRGDKSKLPNCLVNASWIQIGSPLVIEDTAGLLFNAIFERDSVKYLQENSVSPFRGLAYFGVEDGEFYFGRESLVEWLIEDISEEQENKFIAICGASGSGKSSLARAGLLASLGKEVLSGSSFWQQVTLFPGENPLENLAIALSSKGVIDPSPTSIREFIDGTQIDRRFLYLACRSFLSRTSKAGKVVVLIDQFEEVFTQCHSEILRRSFIENICYAVTSKLGNLLLIITLRSDFYGKCAPYQQLSDLISRWSTLVGPMDKEAIRNTITLPAIQNGFAYESGLVDILVNETEPGSLPLLQDTLQSLWIKRENNLITNDHYAEIGGLSGALDQRTTLLFDKLSDSDKVLCRTLFLRLVEPGEGTDDTKRRVERQELLSLSHDSEKIQDLLDYFSSAETRLLRITRDKVEVTHEALIRNWGLLKSWIEEERENLMIHRRLSRDQVEWVRNEQDEAYLYSGSRLHQIEDWMSSSGPTLNTGEEEFVERSREKRAKSRRRTRLARIMGTVAALLFIVVLSISLISINSAKNESQRSLSESLSSLAMNEMALNSYSLESFRLAEEAFLLNPKDHSARISLLHNIFPFIPHQMLEKHEGGVSAKFLKGDSLVLTYGEDEVIRLWHLDDLNNPVILPGHTGQNKVTLSADEELLLTCGEDGLARLWELKNPTNPIILKGHQGKVTGVFSNDGRRILTSDEYGLIQLWHVSGIQQPVLLEGHKKRVTAFFSEKQDKIVSYDEGGSARVWSMDDLDNPQLLQGHRDKITKAILSKKEDLLVTGSSDGTVRVWDLSGSENSFILPSKGFATPFLINNDEEVIVSNNIEDTIKIWSLKNPTQPRIFNHPKGYRFRGWNEDQNKVLMNNFSGGPIYLFNVQDLSSPIVLTIQDRQVNNAMFSNTEDYIIGYNQYGNIAIWNPDDPDGPLPFYGHNDAIYRIFFSADDSRFVSLTEYEENRIWNITNPFAYTTILGKGSINGAQFSKDNSRLLTYGQDGYARIWNYSSRFNPIEINKEGLPLTGFVFHEKTNTGLAFGLDSFAYLWNLEDIENPQLFKGLGFSMYEGEFSKDGQKALIYSETGNTALLLNTSLPDSLVELKGPSSYLGITSFSKDSEKVLLGGDEDSTLFIWEITDLSTPIQLSIPGAIFDSAEFDNDGSHILTSSNDSIVRIWDLEQRKPIAILGGGKYRLRDCRFSIDFQKIAAQDQNKEYIYLWDINNLESPEAKIESNGYPINNAVFNTRGDKILITLIDIFDPAPKGNIILWDLNQPARSFRVQTEETGFPEASFSSDETHILAYEDETAYVWSIDNPQNPIILRGHQGQIMSGRFSTDGKRVITNSVDGTSRIWFLELPTAPIILQGPSSANSDLYPDAYFTDDEDLVISFGADGKVRIWDTNVERTRNNMYEQFPHLLKRPLDSNFKEKFELKELYLKNMQ